MMFMMLTVTVGMCTRDSVRVRVNCMPIAINCDMTCTEWGMYHNVILIDILLLSLCSLYNNHLGAAGGRAIADALKINTTLATLE